MPKPLRVRLLRYTLYLFAALLISLLVLLWQAPTLTQRHLPAWLAKHYGLNLTLGEIHVSLRHPSLAIGPSALLDEKQQPIIAFEQLQLVPELGQSWRQKAIILSDATLTKPMVNLIRRADSKGEVRFNLTDALASMLTPSQTPATTSSEPPLVQIAKLAAVQGHVSYQDSRKKNSAGWIPPLTLSGLDLQLPDFSTAAKNTNHFQLTARLNKQSPLKASGQLDIMTGAGKGQLSLGKLALSPFAPLWAPYLKVNLVKGEASAELNYQLSQGKHGLDWQLSKGKLTLSDWQLKQNKGAEFARFKQLALAGIALDGNKQSVRIDKIALKAPAVTATLDAAQQLDLTALLVPQPADKPSGKKPAPGNPWRWSLKETRISQGEFKLTESSSGKPLLREISGLNLTLGPLGSQSDQPSPLSLNATLNTQSTLGFDGDLTLAPFTLKGEFKQQGLPLKWAQPYLQDLLRITVRDGQLASRTRLDLTTNAEGGLSKLEVTGGLDIDQLFVLDRADNQRLLQIDRLELSGLHYDGISQQVKIGDILLRKPFARIEINEDGITNLQQLVLPQAASTEPANGPVPRITIDQVRTEQGNLRFADRSLSPEFVVDIASLSGQSRHISNIPGQRSDLAFNGKVDRYAPVTIRGNTNLLIEQPVLDVAVTFSNLELTTFTPYSSTYAGYAIDKGQLSMKLNYKLQGNRLEGDNDITIKKLQLGEKIKSEQAKDMPLGLAIALLSDANGVIQMNLKVKGNLDQPNFSLGNIFWDVLGNTLRKAITSPFSLLASLTGGTEDLDELPFLLGEPALTPTQQIRLTKLAQALKERPKISMNIRGKVNFNEELGDLADRSKLDEESPALRSQAMILLRDQQLITAKSLRNLAMRRAQNTKEYLVDTQGIAPERLFVLDSQVKEADKEAKVVLTLDN
ncbi:DUF748 domain-containing protein [Aeromonas salmonicida subsp. achromogenes]|uniref:DUF748 domain-containing protein n=1 Tax=Aeromonas salmonicida TaxID=645 RepID=UPI0003109A7F|nr:DUF748 domain-containing protein [Aeromonas salmonicida]TMX11225.1 DUF748 domain-containing protein [Aeromonas salmonicida subsp. achromogenes]TMX14345.1 DUF748 domain-containing protein [Aeromonas salmonicida subsp. achromogenes]TMX14722.1 DUF748 domain-containing protein [Aeromonas salmonicida subsp. achromogenes]TMX20004.1 DUF748 domain-containing protein [Aeromonas salmonicida subsp. achromogenes]